jgi:hypothetical protein
MATPTFTYDNKAIRESLLSYLTNIDPVEDQLYVGLKKDKATAPYHQWVKDTLNAPATNAQVEGADASFAARVAPTRSANYTQIIRRDIMVSGSDKAANAVGFNDRFTYETEKALKEWRRDAELAVLRGSLASGSGSAARQMAGIKAQITTNLTSSSGVSLSESMFNDYLQNAWTQGGLIDEIYSGARLKRRISGFSGGNVKNVDAKDKRIVNSVDWYLSEFGLTKMFMHRFMTYDNDVNYDLLGLQSDKWGIAHLRDPHYEEVAKTGDANKGMIIGEPTVEALAENSSFLTTKLL